MKRREFLLKGLLLGAAGFLPKVELPASELSDAAAPPELIRLEMLLKQWFIATQRQTNIIERGVSDLGTLSSYMKEHVVFLGRVKHLQKTLAPYRDVSLEQWGWKNTEERLRTEAVLDRCVALRKRIEANNQVSTAYYIKMIFQIQAGLRELTKREECLELTASLRRSRMKLFAKHKPRHWRD